MIGRIPILDVAPVVDAGRWPARAVVGEAVPVSATVFREGHGAIGAAVVLRDPQGRRQAVVPMVLVAPGFDRWTAWVAPESPGRWTFTVQAWADPYATWRHAAAIKVPARVDVAAELLEGATLLARAVRTQRPAPGRRALLDALAVVRDTEADPADRLAAATGPDVIATLTSHPLRELVTIGARYPMLVHRERALVGSWYEMFPRSEGAWFDEAAGRWHSGTLATAARRLPEIAAMGFDVVYLPPVHPIGTTARKGPNNAPTAGAADPGSPWAIGSELGGHDAIHPELGTFDDFDRFVQDARQAGLEVALDLALQCSPDHPWVREHPEWFHHRADGSIAYAENPPKKYEDIVGLDFDADPEGLYTEVLRIVRLWMSHGVQIFRVDNPHTKPVPFWERLLAEVATDDPDVLFLAEAFTRPAMMATLAKVGFHQSYTYFTWRNTAAELTEYLTELAADTAAYMRPNFFVNTPDILTEFLQYGGPAAFRIRAVLAALLSPTWGVYSGFELCEHVAVRPGSEEYLDAEKYQYRPRDWQAAAQGRSIAGYLTRLNRVRRSHPALQRLRTLRFHRSDDPGILCWSKTADRPDGTVDVVIAAVVLDPHGAHETTVHLDLPALGMDPEQTFTVRDEMTGSTWRWGAHDYVRLDPFDEPAHLMAVMTGAR
ncbi:MAG: alpha-1,4-glucan--maltose-1-phosphate maltosyltransferase [Actinomycetes bacterium]